MRFERRLRYQEKAKALGAAFLEHASTAGQKTKLEQLRAAGHTSSKQEVVIIGAGMAGLSSAYELQKLGYSITLLEAQTNHVGGRVRTFRKDGLYAELGAMRIPESHTLTNGYISEFSLPTRPFVQNNPKAFAYFRGKKALRSEDGIESLKENYQLSPEEAKISADDMWVKAVVDSLSKLSKEEKEDLYTSEISTNKIKNYDQNSLYNRLRDSGLSTAAIEYVTSAYGVATYLPTGLTEHFREENDEIWLGNFREIVGGLDLLATAFEERLNTPIVKGAKVFKISQEAGQPIVFYTNADGNVIKLAPDWVICTIPLGVLSRMDIETAFSPEKMNAIRNAHYDSSTKILTFTKDRFWEKKDKIYGGGTIWDGIIGHTWYPSDNAEKQDPEVSDKQSLLLSSYSWGQYARRIDDIPNKEVNHFVYSQLSKVHIGLKEEDIISSVRWSWDNFEWSSGAFSFFLPGQHTDMMSALVKPEGKILLAGEHCSFTHSWIQGALESAVHTCNYITQEVTANETLRLHTAQA